MKTLRVAMVGFGNAGRELARILVSQGQALRSRTGVSLMLTGITTRTRGEIIDPHGIDLPQLLHELETTGRLPAPARPGEGDACRFIFRCPSDVVVEITPLDIMTAQPATAHIETALRLGKHVVTANKGPIAWGHRRLAALARENGVRLLFESTVMDGLPVFNMARHCLRGCTITGFRGIVNSTTNYILDEMSGGLSFRDALAKAQLMGIAEADPSLDVDGWDAAAKTAVLMNVLMDAGITPRDIELEGISGVNAARLAEVRARGRVLKLVSEGSCAGGTVRLEEIPLGHPFAGVSGTSSILSLRTDLMGEITLIENTPTITQTAYGLLNDLLEVASSGPHTD